MLLTAGLEIAGEKALLEQIVRLLLEQKHCCSSSEGGPGPPCSTEISVGTWSEFLPACQRLWPERRYSSFNSNLRWSYVPATKI